MNYKFNWIDSNDRTQYISDCLQGINDIPGLSLKNAIRLKQQIAGAISFITQESKLALAATFSNDFANPELVRAAVDLVLQRKYGRARIPYQIAVYASEGDGRFKAETNLGELTNLSDLEVRQVVQAGLLGISSTNQVIGEMKAYNALSGFKQDELPLFCKKLDFLANHASSESRENSFGRVLEISDVPSFQDSDSILDIDRLLKVRESGETREFRDWLISGGSSDEKEIKEHITGFRVQAGLKLTSNIGKTMRFFITTLSGMLPIHDATAISIGVGVLDSFVLEKIFPRSGIAAFVNELYPSIFESKR